MAARADAGRGLTAGPWRLALPGGRWPEGAEATLAVRPEDLVPDPQGAPARVRRVINLGHYLLVLLDGPGVPSLRMFTEKGASFSEGQEVRLRIARGLVFCGPEVVEIGGPMRPSVVAPTDRA